jgi:hypothetical protein
MNSRMMPPVVGIVGNLRVAAGLIRERGQTSIVNYGVILLANGNYSRRAATADETCLKLIGEITVDRYKWEVEATITAERLEYLIGKTATDQLSVDSLIGQSSQGEKVIDLVVRNPGITPTYVPTLNGIPMAYLLREW